MKIQIETSSSNEIINIFLDTENNLFLCNGREVKNSVFDFQQRLLDIVIYWDSDMEETNALDAERFLVNIVTEEEVFSYKGCGIYPDNYSEFKALLSGVIYG